jgi:hypothetical protein
MQNLHDSLSACQGIPPKDLKNPPRQWVGNLRIEQRCGALRYIVQFTDGRLRASLYGNLEPLTASPSALKQAAWTAALNWMAHTRPGSDATEPQIKQLYYIRNCTRPGNKSHRQRRMGRRAVQ